MADIIFCELCGGESKNDIIEMRGRTIKVCSSCLNAHIAQIDNACSKAWDSEIAKIQATKTIDTNKQAVIQTKIDELNTIKSAMSVNPIEIKK